MKFSYSCLRALTAVLVLLPALRGSEPWDSAFAPMKRPCRSRRARQWYPKPGAVVLLEDRQYKIDREGRTSSILRKVIRIANQNAAEQWSSVEQEYEPWHDKKPNIRARVITAEGIVYWLDPKTISDGPAHEFDSSRFSGPPGAAAPLPAVSSGAIVEYEIAASEMTPVFAAGVTHTVVVMDIVPLQRFHLSIEAQKEVPLRTATQNIPDSAIRRQNGEVTRIDCDLGPFAARKTFENNLPSDLSNFSYLSFSTGKSWQDIAGSYESMADSKLRSADLKPFIEGIDLSGGQLAVATRLAAKLHQEIRYTGLEFGEGAIVPGSPQETLRRKYGDCKDKAAVLVAMLRAAGMKAYLALLSAGSGTDVDADLPGFGIFNHAIVYVEGPEPLWIDATAMDTRVGELPLADQGRRALVASRNTTGLLKTPESSSKDNLRTHSIEIRMSDFGPGEIRETVEARGSRETAMRGTYDGEDDKGVKEALDQYVKRDFVAKSLGQFRITRKQDFTGPFRLSVQALETTRAVTTQDDAVAVLFPNIVFQDVPFDLFAVGPDNKREPRKHPFTFYEPHQTEYRYKIIPPPSFKVKELPTSVEIKLGPAAYSRTYRRNSDESVDVLFRFDTQKRTLTPAEFEEFRDGMGMQFKMTPDSIRFVSAASEYLALGETGKALAAVRKHLVNGSNKAGPQIQLSRVLVKAGAKEDAIAAAKKATELDPASGQAWEALGFAHEHDAFGRRFRGNWNLAEAEKCYRKAIALDARNVNIRLALATLLEHNLQGLRYGKGARLEEAAAVYRQILADAPDTSLHHNLTLVLLFLGRYQEARDEAKKVADLFRNREILTAATALTDGPARAITEARGNYSDDPAQSRTLVIASSILGRLRRYDLSDEMLKAAARISNSPELQARLDLVSRLKRVEDAQLPVTDPAYPVQQLVVDRNPALTREISRRLELLPQNVPDVAASIIEFDKLGDDDLGYRIKAHLPSGDSVLIAYVSPEAGQFRVIGTTDNPESIGRRVLKLVDEGDLKSAQWWLDTISEDLHAERPPNRGPESLRIAANSLIARYSYSEEAIQVLKQSRLRAAGHLEKAQVDFALCHGLNKAQSWEELLTVARRLGTFPPLANDSFQFIVNATTGAKHWKELQADAETRLQTAPDYVPALKAMATVMMQSGDHEKAADFMHRMTALPLARIEEQEFEAWHSMLIGKADMRLLARLGRARIQGTRLNADYWYTLGTLQAFLGSPEDARQSLMTALDQDDIHPLDARPWTLLGKIHQLYGLPDSAAAEFAKAKINPAQGQVAQWALSMAAASSASDLPVQKASIPKF